MSLTKEKEKNLKEVFFILDNDKDGWIEKEIVGKVLRGVGVFLTEKEVEEIGKEVKVGINGKVDYETIKKVYCEKMKDGNKNAGDLNKAFKILFDKEDTGIVNINDIKHSLMTLGEPLSEEELEMIIQDIEFDDDGNFDFLIEYHGEILPIEVKSGKGYTVHSALNNVLSNEDYSIKQAFVFANCNVTINEKTIYYPIYFCMFLQERDLILPKIPKVDFSQM